jgi:hypothetical protein
MRGPRCCSPHAPYSLANLRTPPPTTTTLPTPAPSSTPPLPLPPPPPCPPIKVAFSASGLLAVASANRNSGDGYVDVWRLPAAAAGATGGPDAAPTIAELPFAAFVLPWPADGANAFARRIAFCTAPGSALIAASGATGGTVAVFDHERGVTVRGVGRGRAGSPGGELGPERAGRDRTCV